MSMIALHFTRSSDSSKDDVIVIKPEWSSCRHGVSILEYSVAMTTASCANQTNMSTTFEQVLSAVNLRKYLHSLLCLLPSDTNPFASVQVDLPNTPSVTFEQKTLYTNAWCILSLVDVAIDSWPKPINTSVTHTRIVG